MRIVSIHRVAEKGAFAQTRMQPPGTSNALGALHLPSVKPALHKKSGLGTRDGSSVLNKPPLLVVACNFCAKLAVAIANRGGRKASGHPLGDCEVDPYGVK